MSIPGEMAPGQEIYSIDESFLDATGIASYMLLKTFAYQMRNRVRLSNKLSAQNLSASALPNGKIYSMPS